MERRDGKRPKRHGHVRAWLAVKKATRWSRLHGELYLGQKPLLGEVMDVEGLKVVLWLRGIRQWHSILMICSVVVAASSSHRSAQGGRQRGNEMARGREGVRCWQGLQL
jgi:hypothetical protein